MDDKQLVDAFLQARSEEAFRAIYRSKTPRLYQMALRLAGQNRDVAEELIQEMWTVAVKRLASFEWRSELRTWLTGILVNVSRRRFRTNELERLARTKWVEATGPNTTHPSLTVFDLENAIRHLPYGYRQILILHDVEGYTHKEISSLLEISEGTSKSQLYHARRAIRSYLTEETSIQKNNP